MKKKKFLACGSNCAKREKINKRMSQIEWFKYIYNL